MANRDPSRPVTPPCPADEPERHFDGKVTVHVVDGVTGQPLAGALVDPGMMVDEAGVIASPFFTSATGEGIIRYPTDRATSLWVSVEKEDYGSRNASVDLAAGETDRLEFGAKTGAEDHRHCAGRRGRAAGGRGIGALAGVARQVQGSHDRHQRPFCADLEPAEPE